MSPLQRLRQATSRRVRGTSGRMVSVVVVVRGRAVFLDTCLSSILDHEHGSLEVLVVAEPGDAAAAAAVAASSLTRKRHVRVLPPGSPDTWVDAAIAQARGDYLAFAEADDVVTPGAYADLVGLLERTGSDFAVGAPQRVGPGRTRQPAWRDAAFAEEASRQDVASRPDLLVDLALTNKVLRRSWWDTAGLSLPTGWAGALATAARVYLTASRFDVCPRRVYEEHSRDFSLPVEEQARFRVDVAAATADALLEVSALVQRHAPALHQTWMTLALTHLLPPLYVDAVGGGPDFLAAVARPARELLSRIEAEQLAAVPVHPRLATCVAAHGSLDDVALVEDLRADHPHGLPTDRAGSGAQLVVLPHGLRLDVPEEFRRIEAVDRRPRTTVDRVLGQDDGQVRVTGGAFVEYTAHQAPPTVTIGAGGDQVPLEVTQREDPKLNEWAARAFEDRTGCGFTATLEQARLPESADGRWTVDVHVGRSRHRHTVELAPVADPRGAELVEVTLVDDDDAVARLAGTGGAPTELRLTSAKGSTAWAPVSVGGGRWSVDVPLTVDLFGTTAFLPGGAWSVEARRDGGAAVALQWSPAVLADPPELVGARLRLLPVTAGRGGPALRVAAPLHVDERSAYGQHRLLSSVHAAGSREANRQPTVLLETFRGRSVGDSPGAIGQELLRRGQDLDLAWVVDDPGVVVPDGTRAVPRRSASWYEALAGARAYVSNAGAPYWFQKKPGQVHLQTWHGTPLKRIGEDRGPGDFQTWRHRRRIAAQAGGWDAMVSPNPFCSEIFPRAFRFYGKLLEIGYPRNDLLVTGGEAAGDRVRAGLGLGEADRVVLYAPTWREYVGVRDAKPLFLDADLLTRLLPDTVVLVRGHYNSTTQGDVFSEHPRIHDVTRYPDITDLYLAADALVTDYSSVMFDYPLTDRPIVLLTPDLEQYRDVERGFYFDLERLAPGPMVRTTEEVASALAAPDEHGPAREAFRARFCPWEDGRASARAADWLLSRL